MNCKVFLIIFQSIKLFMSGIIRPLSLLNYPSLRALHILSIHQFGGSISQDEIRTTLSKPRADDVME